MPPVIIVLGILAVVAGLILEYVEKKKENESEPVVEETDEQKAAKLLAAKREAQANDETDSNLNTDGAGNGTDSGDLSETEIASDSKCTSINLDS